MEKFNVDIVSYLWQFQDENGNLVVKKDKTPLDYYGIKTTTEFAKYLYKDSYANVLVVSVWNKIYRKEFISGYSFNESLKASEDEDWVNQIYSQEGKVYCDNIFGYVYVQNNDSLTHKNFSSENLNFLNIVKQRVRVFENNDFIVTESKKLYLNLYIEYYYKTRNIGISFYLDNETYKQFLFSLFRKCSFKTFARFMLFLYFPKIYKYLTDL